jgi:hypothetical protein
VGRSDAVLLALLIPLLLGVIALGVLAWRTYRSDRQRAQARRDEAVRRQASRIVSRVPPVRRSPDAAVIVSNVVALNLSPSEETRVPFPMPPQAGVKACPSCRREFRTALLRCPFDQSHLVDKATVATARGQEDYLDTQRALMRCSMCDRRYDLGANYCPYDGEQLEGIEEEDERAVYEGGMTCPECARLYEEDASFCPEDGARLLPSEPAEGSSAWAAIPLRICPACTTEYAATVESCPKDGERLLALAGRTTGGHPTHGLGPRTKICPCCGVKCAADVRFCSSDGMELRSLN